MTDILFTVAIPDLGKNAVAGQCTNSHRGDKLLGGGGHHAAHTGTALAQSAYQVETLVGSNATADDQHNRPVFEGLGKAHDTIQLHNVLPHQRQHTKGYDPKRHTARS
jgi:hypothetical protein